MEKAVFDAGLPVFPADRADAVQERVFARIGQARARSARRRRTGWTVGLSAAAIVVVAAVISPAVLGSLPQGASSAIALKSESTQGLVAPGAVRAPGLSGDGSVAVPGPGTAEGATGSGGAADAAASGQRDVVATASQSLTVDDVARAATSIGAVAESLDGTVDSTSISAVDPAADGARIEPYGYPVPGSWVQVRVPADRLTELMAQVGALGRVTDSAITRQDVTAQAVDLRARVAASQAAVDRLTQLVAQAANVSDLIAAESALADRQATLESLQQQLTLLEGQVAMSTLTVSLTPEAAAAAADPAGFWDGLQAGANGLVAALNGLVVGLGFLLPWLAVAAVLALIAWAIVRLVRSARRRPPREE